MEKSAKKKIFKAFVIIKNVVCWALVICLTIVVIGLVMSKANGGMPSVFGFSVMRISSGSMEPELMTGDVILSREISDISQLKTGDVVTYQGSGTLEGVLVTHEVIKPPYINENGQMMLQTKGVANEVADDPIYADSVVTVMVCKIPLLNVLYNVFFSPWGLVIFIFLVLLIFIDEIIRIVRILSGNEKSVKDAEDINEIIDRLQKEKNTDE